MDIQHKQASTKGVFYIEGKDNYLAELDYSLTPGQVMIINHTEVDDFLRGQDIGRALVNTAAGYARKNQLKIIPQCSFANALMKRNKAEYADVLKEN
ncbi:MAG: family N-acetyltransferase [Ferruginibacter sp.]|uniref:GNAT family N-acetyltransferase n=1 Tax=Ferruginibacter sp. TaxID=1940288 RepID=UPI00265878C3|nr:GNAT family N-acetyltransferase [Ferruginibacter sp.]MDB5277154.1 family N-acetyltransferase [Ferruginibacter sp.]